MRSLPLLAAAAVFGLTWAGTVSVAGPTEGASVASWTVSLVGEARADGDIGVGSELVATGDVSLDDARLCRGSRVSVSAKSVAAGKVFLDVALADGHVVKAVPLLEIRKNFRVVGR